MRERQPILESLCLHNSALSRLVDCGHTDVTVLIRIV